MQLSQVNQTFDHKITSGSEYQWNCFPDARFLDYESDFAHISVLYSTSDQKIYQADASLKRDAWPNDNQYDKPYRWTNPFYKDAYLSESKKRNIDPDQAWDNIKWIDLEVEDDWLEKATAMFNGEVFDTRVQMEVDLDDDLILGLAKEAHKRDITLNTMIEVILQEVIDRHRVNGTFV
jgi:hypothetical protein